MNKDYSPKPTYGTAWTVFWIAIIILILAILFSIAIIFNTKQSPEEFQRNAQGTLFMWFFVLSLLFVGMFLCLCPVRGD